MRAPRRLAIKRCERTRERGGLRAPVVCSPTPRNTLHGGDFTAWALRAVINFGVSGPGVVHHAVRHAPRDLPS